MTRNFLTLPSGLHRRTAAGFFLLVAGTALLAFPAAAHAPANITIVYNPDMHKLFVTVIHPVDDPAVHYLKSVQVRLNGNVISDPQYTSQPGRTAPTYTYDVMANPGDTVWVTATCVKGGSLEAHTGIQKPVIPTLPVRTTPVTVTTVSAVTATAIPVRATTYAATGLLPLAGAAAAVFARGRR